MQLQNLKPNNRRKTKKRIGRGGKRGTYAGRGLKGQKSRAGRRIRPVERDAIKKIPKKRGYKAKRFRQKPIVINVSILEEKYTKGELVTPATLRAKGVVKKGKKRVQVKLLGSGALTKKLLVEQCQVSASAKQKIIKAGGAVKE